MIPTNKLARATGILYLLIVAGGVFAEAFVRSSILDYGDPQISATNIKAHEGLFRLGFSIELLVFLIDAAVCVLLYVLLRPVDKTVALLAATFRIVTVAMLGINLLNNYLPLLLLSGSDYLAGVDEAQLRVWSLLYMKAHGHGYSLGLAFFGIHCILLGYLIKKSDYLPGLLGILMAIAGVCYLTNSYTIFLFPEISGLLFPAILIPAFIAELSLSLWLLLKGVGKMNTAA